jgi:glucosylceramidase
MSDEPSRRDFLRLSALGLAATTASASIPRFQQGAGASSEIKIWVTSGKLRFAPQDSISWQPTAGPSDTAAIILDPARKFQEILGFGAALTDSTCYMFNQLAAEAREALFRELFHPSEMGLSVCRTCIGASDYATKAYSYNDGDPDPELTRFSIAHDREYILPMLRLAREMNPELFLFCSPWSPPGWMKSGGSMLGGSMRRKYLPVYARYFLKFLQAYAAEGVPIQAITPQNEVDTDQDGRMPACIWAQEYEIEFVGKHLGPLLQKEGLETKIWILDHNYNLWGRATCELDDPVLRQHCGGVAWHGYVGEPEMMSKVHEAHPAVGMHWTEGGPDYTSPDYLTDWTNWGKTFTAALRNWCRSITAWNLALDERGRRPDVLAVAGSVDATLASGQRRQQEGPVADGLVAGQTGFAAQPTGRPDDGGAGRRPGQRVDRGGSAHHSLELNACSCRRRPGPRPSAPDHHGGPGPGGGSVAGRSSGRRTAPA